jgi:FkbM family methyltransferase
VCAYLDPLGEPGDTAVKVVTLFEAVPNLKRLDFVKLDVEGAEITAIEAGRIYCNAFVLWLSQK